jgi:GNAT superfamily N-acetyltransferase
MLEVASLPSWRVGSLPSTGRIPLDAALIQVSPPDDRGFCSLGPSVDVVEAAMEAAGIVVAEVNPCSPRTWGESMIHVDQVDALVAADHPLPQIARPVLNGTHRLIARHVAKLVPDQATLHVCMGPIPEAVLWHLVDKRNLGIHTATPTDGVMDLVEAGAVLNRAKTLHPDRIVATRCLGTTQLYEYANNNPLLEPHPAGHICASEIVAQNYKTAAINTALAVDLAGGACLTLIGQGRWRSTDGDAGMARGAAQASDGRSIIALPALDEGGRSRIGLDLPEGTISAIDRYDVDYVVTEYGVAELRGRDLAERALEIINVAHPAHRRQLHEQAQLRGLVDGGDLPPRGTYPVEFETVQAFPGGLTIRARPIKPSDERLLREMFYRLSDQTLYLRFFRIPHSMPPEMIRHADRIDYERQMAVAVLAEEAGRERIIGVGRYVQEEGTGMGDVALVVQDAYQRQGIGSWLLAYMAEVAQRRGLKGLRADILVGNYRALGMVNKTDANIEATLEDGYYRVRYRFE